MRLPIDYTLRLAIVRKVGRTYVDCEFFDRFGEKPIRCPIPNPYSGRGGGILIGVEPDTLVLLANSSQEKWYIVGFIPDIAYYNDIEGSEDINFNETAYPELKPGELSVKAKTGQKIELLADGRLILDAGIGNKSYDLELSPAAQGMFIRVNNLLKFTEAGRSIEGIIKRDLRLEENQNRPTPIDFLTGSTYDFLLSEIGRSPLNESQYRTTMLSKYAIRNPSLVEKRDTVYEYANSFDVGDFEAELNAMLAAKPEHINDSIAAIQSNPFSRENRRTDTLNVNYRNYNNLIEKIQGTLVDIYGNILDINRNIVPVPSVESINTINTRDRNGLKKIYTYLRRSVKYHLEINSRKEEDLIGIKDVYANNEAVNSKWSIDVDGEGLTKINIPASSNVGNIPVLGRYINSQDINDPTNGSFKDKNKKDIWLSQFGALKVEEGVKTTDFAGAKITDPEYIPGTIEDKEKRDKKQDIISKSVTVGTAYHDIFNVANSIFTNGKLKSPDPKNSTEAVLPMSSAINNKIFNDGDFVPEEQLPNAGGRSVHMNLDGSLEMSIGADTVDKKSIVLDTAGGVVSHFGRDKNGRSIIHQTDGDIIIQVGGPGVGDDTRFTDPVHSENRPGRVEIHLNRPGGTPQKIVIDEDGMNINIIGNGVISSSGDLILSAGGKLLLNAEIIEKYGSFDNKERTVTGSELKERRKGFAN